MSVFIGKDGVTREVHDFRIGHVLLKHNIQSCGGADGVVRPFLEDIEQTIDHIEIKLEDCYVDNVDFSEWYDLEALKRYGSLSITNNSILLTCSTGETAMEVGGSVYVVFKDGHEIDFDEILPFISNLEFSVTGYLYASVKECIYDTRFLDIMIIDGYVSGSTTRTKIIDLAAASAERPRFNIFSQVTKASGTQRNKQTYNYCKINDRNIPIIIVNFLTQEGRINSDY